MKIVYSKTIKCKMENIYKPDVDYTKLLSCVKRTNEMVFTCSHFIRAYIIHLFNADHSVDLPNLDYNFIRMTFVALSEKAVRGPKSKNEQAVTLDKLSTFYDSTFAKYISDAEVTKKIDSKNLSYFYNLAAKEMETAYLNNIKLNFFKYLNQYVNQHFINSTLKKLSKDEHKQLSTDDKIKYIKDKSEEAERIKLIKKEIAKSQDRFIG